MSTELVIIGCGARTPVGFDRRSSAAAVRAGIAAIAEHPFMLDRFGEPMKVARDAGLDPALTGLPRLFELAISAAREALAPLKGARRVLKASVVIALGEERPGQDRNTAARLADELCDALNGPIRIGERLHSMEGHAGGILAMETGRRLIVEGDAELVLAGGVDSYMCPDTLDWLDEIEQLHSEGNIYGFCPGEAAGFVLIARMETARRLGLAPLIALMSVGSGIERNLIKTEDICLGDGLSAAFRTAAETVRNTATIDRIICDMNGERYRGNEYGFAVLKTAGLFKNAAAFEAPADCWGDVGAAGGPLYAGLVIEAEERGYSRGPLSLIWASSEGGRRGAAILCRRGAA
jgi:3-oxoacyl-[acyl-carrier-protein] synthase-1